MDGFERILRSNMEPGLTVTVTGYKQIRLSVRAVAALCIEQEVRVGCFWNPRTRELDIQPVSGGEATWRLSPRKRQFSLRLIEMAVGAPLKPGSYPATVINGSLRVSFPADLPTAEELGV